MILALPALLLVAAAGYLWRHYEFAGVRWLPREDSVFLAPPAGHAGLEASPTLPPSLEIIGNPAARRYPDCSQAFARNPWDLLAFEGRLYIALGDYSNEGPSPNAGPVPVLAYDPRAATFHQETTLPEEQIDRYYAHDGQLWIPGTDPRASWRWGNLYRRAASGVWRQYRTLPRTIHAHALAWHEGRIFAGTGVTEAVPDGVGLKGHGSAVAVSADGGRHWDLMPLGGWRIFEFLTVADQFFAVDIFPGPGIQGWLDREQRQAFHAPLYEYAGPAGFRRRPDLDAATLLPDTPTAGSRAAVIERAVARHGQSAYIGAFAPQADDSPVRGAYLAASLQEGGVHVQRIALPAGALAMDLSVENGALRVLFAEPLPPEWWRNTVWASPDGRRWEPLLSFDALAPARSFARLGEHGYIGLGALRPPPAGRCTPADLASGTLLRWPTR